MSKYQQKPPTQRRFKNTSGMITNAIPLPETPNGMDFERTETEQYFRIVEQDLHESKEAALPSEPIEDLIGMPTSPSRDWMYEHKLQRQVEEGGRFMIRPMANRKALHDRYDMDDDD